MIIVTGSVQARPEHLDEVLALSLEHVHRSRAEPGCLLHTVHQDVEDAHRVVFVEHWADLDALRTHFAVPASGGFVEALAGEVDRIRQVLTGASALGDVQLFSQLKALGEIKAALATIPDQRARELEARVAQLLEASFRSGRFAQI